MVGSGGDGVPRRAFLEAVGTASALSGVVRAKGDTGSGVYVKTMADRVRLGNEHLEIVFRRANGGIEQFRGKAGGFDLLDTDAAPARSWKLRFYSQTYERLEVLSDEAGQATLETTTGDREATVIFEWSNPPFRASSGDIDESFDATITVEVSLSADDRVSRWQMDVENRTDRSVRQLICPCVSGISALSDDGSDAMYTPRRMGRKYTDPTAGTPGVHRYPSGFGTMQFVTFLADEHGIYVAAEDTGGYAKRLEFSSLGGHDLLEYEGTHLVTYRPGEDVSLPYAMTLGVHEGTWRDACDRYREWVESEGWLGDVDSMVPDRVRRWGLAWHERSYTRPEFSGNNRITFGEMERMMKRLQTRLDVPMAFRWWGWAKNGWPALGDWLPPKEGGEAYEAAVDGMTEADIDTLAYLNPNGVIRPSDFLDEFDALDRLVVERRTGEPRTVGGTPSGTEVFFVNVMDPTWKQHVSSTIDGVIDMGARGIDLDGFPWRWVPNCWNDDHDHPPGKGGNWYPRRMRAFLRDVHDVRNSTGRLTVCGEGIADFYLPYMNVHLTKAGYAEETDDRVASGDDEVIPMFPYTFGEYAEPMSLKGHIGGQEPRNVQRLIAGRAIDWGAVPVTMGDYSPISNRFDHETLTYLARIGDARARYANRFLAGGTMLERPSLDRRAVTISQGGIERETDEIRGRGWRSREGDLGIVLTNVSNRYESRTLEIDLATQPFDVPENPLVYVVVNGQHRAVDGTAVEIQLDPSDVALVAAVPDTTGARKALAGIVEAQTIGREAEDALAAAARAFDAHEYKRSVEITTEAIEASEDTPMPTSEQPTVETATSPPATEFRTRTSGSGPGFGIGTAAGGIAGCGVLLRWLLDEENGKET